MAARPEQVVAGMRIAVERVELVDAAEHEPVDRLAREVALGLRPALDLGEPRADRQLGREHASRSTARRSRAGTEMNGWPANASAKKRWFAASLPVVELLGEPLAQLVDERSGIEAGEHHPEHAGTAGRCSRGRRGSRRRRPGTAPSPRPRRPACVTARCTWPIDAAAIGSGSHCANTRSGSSPSSARTTSRAELGRHRRRVLLERRQRVAHRLGQAVVEVARHLADLHQRALHVAERVGDLRRGAQLVLGLELRRGASPGAVASRARCTRVRRRPSGRRPPRAARCAPRRLVPDDRSRRSPSRPERRRARPRRRSPCRSPESGAASAQLGGSPARAPHLAGGGRAAPYT